MTPRILVTRPEAQAGELATMLRDRGLAAVCVPTVAIEHAEAESGLDALPRALDGAAWLVLTSANGAEAVAERLHRGRDLPDSVRVAAVGPATADALRAAGMRVDHVPAQYLTVAIARGLGELVGERVVMARADAATPDLRHALEARGARVTEVVAYRTVEGPARSRDALHAAFASGLDGLAFTSSSTVRGLLRLASPIERGRARNLNAFCIGPVTAATARQLGFEIAAVADEHTAAGLADVIAAHYRSNHR